MKVPSIKDLANLFVKLKKYRYLEDGFEVTVGSDKNGNWYYQIGDNSFAGGAYFYPHWAIVYLDRKSNSRELAREVQSQLLDLMYT